MDHDVWMRIIDFIEEHAVALWFMVVLSLGNMGRSRVIINNGGKDD